MPAKPGHSKAAPSQSSSPGVGAARVRLEQADGGEDRHDRDRNVHDEDPLPGRAVDDDAADDRPEDRPEQDRHSHHRERASDAPRAGALRHQRKSDRDEHAAAEALQDTEGDQLARRRGQRTQRRAAGEQRDRCDPGSLGAEALRDPARDRDHDRQRQQIARRDPLDGHERGGEIPRQGVQRYVDDRRVENRHDEPERRDAGHHERRPVETTRQALHIAADCRIDGVHRPVRERPSSASGGS
jgi:hypothetical protein